MKPTVDLCLPLRPSSARARRLHGSQQPIFADGLTSANVQVKGLDEILSTYRMMAGVDVHCQFSSLIGILVPYTPPIEEDAVNRKSCPDQECCSGRKRP